MYIYVYTYTNTYIYIYMYIYIHMHTNIYIYNLCPTLPPSVDFYKVGFIYLLFFLLLIKF